MADYHCSAKPISRSTGRSATGAAAYRSGEQIVDARTGLVHDYRKKQGVVSAEIVAPAGAAEWATNRELLWNAAEGAEKRKDACVAREYVIALPHELDAEQRRQLALDFARQMVERHGFAADVCIHQPSRGGDQRNHHAHILTTTRQVGPEGLGAKCDIEQAGRKRKDDLTATRALWADVANKHLERAGRTERIDHRTLKEQGIDREPTKHLGPGATGYERRTGESSRRRESWQEAAAAQQRLEAVAAEAKELARLIDTAGGAQSVATTELKGLTEERQALIERATAARDQLFDRYRAAPQARENLALAEAYGMQRTPATAADAGKLLARVDERMKWIDEAEAKHAAEAKAAAQPAPVPKIYTPPAPKGQGTALSSLLAQSERVAPDPKQTPVQSPIVAPAQPQKVDTGTARAERAAHVERAEIAARAAYIEKRTERPRADLRTAERELERLQADPGHSAKAREQKALADQCTAAAMLADERAGAAPWYKPGDATRARDEATKQRHMASLHLAEARAAYEAGDQHRTRSSAAGRTVEHCRSAVQDHQEKAGRDWQRSDERYVAMRAAEKQWEGDHPDKAQAIAAEQRQQAEQPKQDPPSQGRGRSR